jgi:hypothetical protein
VVEGVEFDSGGPEDAGLGGWPAAGEGADAEHEFGKVEWLCEVVVGAEAEAAYALGGGVGGGEHEYHCRVVPLGDHAAEGVAVHAGEVAVEDDHVVGDEVEFGRGVEAVVGEVDGHALVSESFDERVGEGMGVLDDEDSHTGVPLATASGRVTVTRSPPPSRASRSSVPP